MASKVLKWIVPIDDELHVIGPGPVVLVGNNTGDPRVVCVWTQEYHNPYGKSRSVRVFGTGHEIPAYSEVLGSTVQGAFVWHVVDIPGALSII